MIVAKDAVTISIQSEAGKGKSSIAELIRQTLADSGLDVMLLDDNGIGVVEHHSEIADTLKERIQALKGRQIVIRTLQARRGGSL